MEEMYQNNDDKIRQIEKKFFHSLKKSCIIDKLEKGFFMFFHSRTAKIIIFSIVGFCAGLCLTLITFLSFDRPSHKRGVGGYETSVLPELNLRHSPPSFSTLVFKYFSILLSSIILLSFL